GWRPAWIGHAVAQAFCWSPTLEKSHEHARIDPRQLDLVDRKVSNEISCRRVDLRRAGGGLIKSGGPAARTAVPPVVVEDRRGAVLGPVAAVGIEDRLGVVLVPGDLSEVLPDLREDEAALEGRQGILYPDVRLPRGPLRLFDLLRKLRDGPGM